MKTTGSIKTRREFCGALASTLGALRLNGTKSAPTRVLAFYSLEVERDHVMFAEEAFKFFAPIVARAGFEFTKAANWDALSGIHPKDVDLVMWFNDSPPSRTQRLAFEKYMEDGGGWIGFHAAGYNDETTGWPWFIQFLGGAVFYGNNWPPLPAQLVVDDRSHYVTHRLPEVFQSPANEWYIWRPSARENRNVNVLVTLSPTNYPIGLKDTIEGGDVPVVWTNTKYRMIYLNMGHGDKIFTSHQQNLMFEDAVAYLMKHARPGGVSRLTDAGG